MNVIEYVKTNYAELPKSYFNDEEVVVVRTLSSEDYGYGHHSYSAYGVDSVGSMYYCFSSGCSCDGSCGMEHEPDIKKFEVDPPYFPDFNSPELIDYDSQQVAMSDY